MSNYDPILNALLNDLLGILLLFTIFGVLNFVPSMVVAFVAGVRTERTMSELPRGTFWGWVMGVPIWVAAMVLQVGLAEMLLGNWIEKFRDNLYVGFALIGFVFAISMQYLLVVHYFRSKVPERTGWQYDGPTFRPPKRYFAFSLQKLLLAQIALIFLFGVWVGARREGILKEYDRRRQLTEQKEYQESLQIRFGVYGWRYFQESRGLSLESGGRQLVDFDDDVLREITPEDGLYRITLCSDGLTDQGLAILSELEDLEEVEIRSAKVTDAGIAHLKKLKGLRRLHMKCEKLTDHVLDELHVMDSLQEVTLDWKNFSPARVEEFKQQNPDKNLQSYSPTGFYQ